MAGLNLKSNMLKKMLKAFPFRKVQKVNKIPKNSQISLGKLAKDHLNKWIDYLELHQQVREYLCLQTLKKKKKKSLQTVNYLLVFLNSKIVSQHYKYHK